MACVCCSLPPTPTPASFHFHVVLCKAPRAFKDWRCSNNRYYYYHGVRKIEEDSHESVSVKVKKYLRRVK